MYLNRCKAASKLSIYNRREFLATWCFRVHHLWILEVMNPKRLLTLRPPLTRGHTFVWRHTLSWSCVTTTTTLFYVRWNVFCILWRLTYLSPLRNGAGARGRSWAASWWRGGRSRSWDWWKRGSNRSGGARRASQQDVLSFLSIGAAVVDVSIGKSSGPHHDAAKVWVSLYFGDNRSQLLWSGIIDWTARCTVGSQWARLRIVSINRPSNYHISQRGMYYTNRVHLQAVSTSYMITNIARITHQRRALRF